jgi:hypothetical protein
MHLLYCDETNIQERKGDFFLYGGICVPPDRCASLSRRIDEIREAAKVPATYRMKFLPAPEGMSHEAFIELKKAVISAAIEAGAKLLISVILHDIATSPNIARRNAINTLCFHFDCLLKRFKSTGLVLIDRFSDKQIDAHLAKKFSIGVTGLPHTIQLRLSNIVGFHYSAIGQSNFPSLIDILVGSLRFAINAHTRDQQQNLPTASKILESIQPLLFRETEGSPVSELSFFFSPKTIKVDDFRSKYEKLKTFLSANGIDTVQVISPSGGASSAASIT